MCAHMHTRSHKQVHPLAAGFKAVCAFLKIETDRLSRPKGKGWTWGEESGRFVGKGYTRS